MLSELEMDWAVIDSSSAWNFIYLFPILSHVEFVGRCNEAFTACMRVTKSPHCKNKLIPYSVRRKFS